VAVSPLYIALAFSYEKSTEFLSLYVSPHGKFGKRSFEKFELEINSGRPSRNIVKTDSIELLKEKELLQNLQKFLMLMNDSSDNSLNPLIFLEYKSF